MSRYTYTRSAFGCWSILDTRSAPAVEIATVSRGSLLSEPSERDAWEKWAAYLCELLNRDHEMRVAVEKAAKRGDS